MHLVKIPMKAEFFLLWRSADGRTMLMVSCGSYGDYNLRLQKVTLEFF